MPPKKTPAPIDRPLSKAYLRQFSGWSTAYPPGMSEPNSLRVMDNVMITREGAARVRPGMRSYLPVKTEYPLVGSHEVFYTEDGKAYLVAVRTETAVEFRAIVEIDDVPTMVTLAEAGFAELGDAGSIQFSLDTTYVKYVQIDNKIFALSNAPEPMLMFWVGTERKVKRLAEISRPDWTVPDKLTGVQPDGSTWVLSSDPLSRRINLVRNPNFEGNTGNWYPRSAYTELVRSSTEKYQGSHSGRLRSLPKRRNLLNQPLHDVASTGVYGWKEGARVQPLSVVSNSMKITFDSGKNRDQFCYAKSFLTGVTPGQKLRISFDLAAVSNLRRWQTAIRFYRSNNEQIGTMELTGGNGNFELGRKYSIEITVPTQAAKARACIGGYPSSSSRTGMLRIKNVYMGTPPSSQLDGNMGADYYWTGSENASDSVYHPSQTVQVDHLNMAGGPGNYVATVYVKSQVARTIRVEARAYNASGSQIAKATRTGTTTLTWNRHNSGTLAAPVGTVKVDMNIEIDGVPRNESHYIDGAMLEGGTTAVNDYFDGDTAPEVGGLTVRRWEGEAHNSRSFEEVFDAAANSNPPAESPTTSTLISSNPAANVYNFGFFYTIGNEIGESAESQITTIKTQRPWTAWKWVTPTGADTNAPELCADQLVVYMPQDVFDAAIAAGATHWSAYFYTWGPNDVPPVTATKFAEIPLGPDSAYGKDSWARLTPQMVSIGDTDPLIPTEQTRLNSTDPSRGSQGLVAADRLILVGDPADPARISWSGGQAGKYYNFSPQQGGGSKQLTSGNLYLTAAVKLWQNPQSVDTLTILNMGDDGRSNAYYMQPATITSLSESIQVMGFEEISSMPGTSSPYGCEVLNNALYHPQEQSLIKSTANNYNLSHKTVTDEIENMWRALQTHRRIVSSQLENRLYYLVHNRLGEPLEPDCWGNEVWVCDIAAKSPTWSRWRAQGISLRTIEINNVVMMSIVRPDGIFAFAPERDNDQRFDPVTGELEYVNIPWYLETNTQGANRAHDAWCNLQQANVMLGNFEGQMRYGIRGKDVNGMDILLSKLVYSTVPPPDGIPTDDTVDTDEQLTTIVPTDREDFFLIRKLMKEWVFFAGSEYETVLEYTDKTPADVLTDETQWEEAAFGYAYPQPDPVPVAEGMQLSWSAAPSQSPTANGLQGISQSVTESQQYRLTLTVQADVGAARWRVTQGFKSSSAWVTPDGTEQTMSLVVQADQTRGEIYGIEVEGTDWPNAGTHVVTGYVFEALEDEIDVPKFCGGQIGLVQYRYTPATVNVGYEYGSVETFEYGASGSLPTTTDSGVPQPYVDMSIP